VKTELHKIKTQTIIRKEMAYAHAKEKEDSTNSNNIAVIQRNTCYILM
jgi:hypothetical protein